VLVYDVQWYSIVCFSIFNSTVGTYVDVTAYCSIELSVASTVRSYNNHKVDLPARRTPTECTAAERCYLLYLCLVWVWREQDS